jgi:signal transduction histidine kinase
VLVADGDEPVDLREHAGDHFRRYQGRRLRSPGCGPFSLTLSVWDLDVLGAEHLRPSRSLRALLRRMSGVSIYRDGFRVAPYGDRGDDWLELNQRRVNNPTMRVSTNQIVGVVEITQDRNPDLRDRTSREGLIDVPAYHDLKAQVIAALSLLEERRYAQRKAAVPVLPTGTDPVLAALGRARTEGSRNGALAEAASLYQQFRRETERRETILLQMASGGAAAVSLLGQLNGSVALLSRILPRLQREQGSGAPLEQVSRALDLVSSQLEALELLRLGSSSSPVAVDLRSLAQDALSIFAPVLTASGVEGTVTGPTGVLVDVNRSLVLHALLHVVENGILEAALMTKYRWVELAVRGAERELVVIDSGPGIDERRRELIFDPFYSGREGRAGLGLYFARTLLRASGGDLTLSSTGMEFHLRFSGMDRERAGG